MSFIRFGVVAAVTSILIGCGGGGGGGDGGNTQAPPASASAKGLWNGSTSTGRTMSGVVLDDGTYWVIYSMAGNSTVIAGALQGRLTTNGNAVSSSNGRDFNFEGLGVTDFTINGNVAEKVSLDGTVRYSGSSEQGSFSTTYDAAFDLTATLATITGSYSGTAVVADFTEFTSVSITSGGALSGSSSSGCSFSGSASPRSDGNVYNVTVTFQGGACSNGTNTISGVAYYDADSETLYSVGLNGARDNGFLFVASRT